MSVSSSTAAVDGVRDVSSSLNIICSVCQEELSRSSFSKKTIKTGSLICTHCRKTINAQRLKQSPPTKQQHDGRKRPFGKNRRPNNYGYCDYVDQVMGWSCFPALVRHGAVSSAKDVSESMAVLQAAKQYTNDIDNDSIDLVEASSLRQYRRHWLCVGDGATPKTALLAAYWYGTRAGQGRNLHKRFVSIDPQLREEWIGQEPNGVRGLIGFRGTFAEYLRMQQQATRRDGHEDDNNTDLLQSADELIILLVHSHARFLGICSVEKLKQQLRSNEEGGKLLIVSLPCCTRFRHVHDIGESPHVQYEDDCVFSAKRTVEIWKWPVHSS